FGLQGKLQEETLSIRNDDGQLRVSLPGNFLKSVSGMKTEQLNRQIEVLNKLSEILLSLSEQIEKEEIKTREEVLIKLAQAIQENKLGLQN
ncbi:MAG TPA: hypothetical protein PKA06_14040, partial [Gemmatales bacterium]|nr:hypothetical protein [Gemmatales bacterium]